MAIFICLHCPIFIYTWLADLCHQAGLRRRYHCHPTSIPTTTEPMIAVDFVVQAVNSTIHSCAQKGSSKSTRPIRDLRGAFPLPSGLCNARMLYPTRALITSDVMA